MKTIIPSTEFTDKSWIFFYKTLQILGEKYLAKLYQQNKKVIAKWCKDPGEGLSADMNILDIIKRNITDICEAGGADVAAMAMDILLESLDHELVSGFYGFEPPNGTDIFSIDVSTWETRFFFFTLAKYWGRII